MPDTQERKSKTPVIFSYTTANPADSGQGFSQELINCFADSRSQGIDPQTTYKFPWIIRGTPGFRKKDYGIEEPILAIKHIRFFVRNSDYIVAVTSSRIYLIDAVEETVQEYAAGFGAPATRDAPISIASNGFTFVVVQYGTTNGYVVNPFGPLRGRAPLNNVPGIPDIEQNQATNLGITLAPNIDGGNDPVLFGHVSFAYGRYFLTEYRNARFRWSGVFTAADAHYFPADFFAYTESNPDEVFRIEYNGKFLIAVGAETIELFQPSPQTTGGQNAFSKIPGSDINRGCISVGATASIGGSTFWLGRDGKLWRIQDPREVSVAETAQVLIFKAPAPPDVGRRPEGCGIESANLFAWEEDGHDFLAIQTMVRVRGERPQSSETMVFDLTTGFWHKRSSPCDSARHGSWCVSNVEQVRGQTFALKNGAIEEMSRCFLNDNGERIHRRAVSNPIEYKRLGVTMYAFEMDMQEADEVPVGTVPPFVEFCWSTDRGRTFCAPNELYMAPVGTEDQARIRWVPTTNRPYVNTGRSIIVRLDYSEEISFVIFSAWIEDSSFSR